MTQPAAPSFNNTFLRELPGDPQGGRVSRQVLSAAYSYVEPTSVAEPTLVAKSDQLAKELGLDKLEDKEFAQVFSGNSQLSGMQTYAMCYGGHQFGNWAGQLGDGRAIGLGQVRSAGGNLIELQLKGAGPTPYSRGSDGRAVLRSSLREFVCSEAMHALDIPTTRALSLVVSGEPVVRDMLYDGNAKPEPGAIVCRTAPTFLRFGNYQLPTARGNEKLLRELVQYTLVHHFPHLMPLEERNILAWLKEVARSTAETIAHWMRVGFVHGVMNTDNMSILGLTIDYGPYGWLEGFDPGWTPNTTDRQTRRYRFGNQPRIGIWNVARLCEGIAPLLSDKDALESVLEAYGERFDGCYGDMLRLKLGLPEASDEARELSNELFGVLVQSEVDMTLFYRGLMAFDPQEVRSAGGGDDAWLAKLQHTCYAEEGFPIGVGKALIRWLASYADLLTHHQVKEAERLERMGRTNPLYVPRNYLAQEAIDDAEQGDYTRLLRWVKVLQKPYTEQPGAEAFAEKRPEWARHRAGCSMLSCSS